MCKGLLTARVQSEQVIRNCLFPTIPRMSTANKDGTGYIVTFREDFEKRHEQLEKRLSKTEKKYTISMNSLSYEDAKVFLEHRLQDEEFRIVDSTVHPPSLGSDD